MVCIYCGSATQVSNSRLQKQTNNVWRRRRCTHCAGIFTTHETPDLGGGLAVTRPESHKLEPFSRDALFVSIYEACKHRRSALTDASALTQTVIAKLIPAATHGKLEREDIVTITRETLEHFDAAAATVYAAYHRP